MTITITSITTTITMTITLTIQFNNPLAPAGVARCLLRSTAARLGSQEAVTKLRGGGSLDVAPRFGFRNQGLGIEVQGLSLRGSRVQGFRV